VRHLRRSVWSGADDSDGAALPSGLATRIPRVISGVGVFPLLKWTSKACEPFEWIIKIGGRASLASVSNCMGWRRFFDTESFRLLRQLRADRCAFCAAIRKSFTVEYVFFVLVIPSTDCLESARLPDS
jgi:hypothetical protein